MAERLPVISSRDFERAVGRIGYRFDHATGSHRILRNETGAMLSVPFRRELAKGTLRKLIRHAGLEVSEFMDLYRGRRRR